jgi:hypothetical protein
VQRRRIAVVRGAAGVLVDIRWFGRASTSRFLCEEGEEIILLRVDLAEVDPVEASLDVWIGV